MFFTAVFFLTACVIFLQNKQRTAHRHQVNQNSVVSADLKLIQASPGGTVYKGTDFTHSTLLINKPAQGVRHHDIGLPNISFQRRFPRPPYNYSSNKYVNGEDGTQKLSMATGAGDQHQDYEASDHVKERGFQRMNLDGEETYISESPPAEDSNG